MMKERRAKENSEIDASVAFGGSSGDKNKSVSNTDRARARQKFLKGPQIPYGKTRLKSSHNMKGKIDVPWDYVGSYYHCKTPI